MIRRTITTLAATGLCLGAFAAPAVAQPPMQEGLVNLNISEVGVQIPIAVAANICDVNVAVLVSDLQDGEADCVADSTSTSDITFESADGGPPRQQGLVNVNVSDVAVQVPVGVAANVCDVNVGVLVDTLLDAPANCDADASGDSTITALPA